MTKFRPLLLDNWRCHPQPQPEHNCTQCARWVNNQDQTFGPRTPLMKAVPDSPQCHWVAAYEEDEHG